MSQRFLEIFQRTKSVIIGMIHVKALPGSPLHSIPMQEIINSAVRETETYVSSGLDGIMIENMHDLPYLRGDAIGPEVVAGMATVATVIKNRFPQLPVGVQILKAGNKQALAVAKATGCDFVRIESFTLSHISDAGWVDACAGDLLRYRRNIGADNVMVWADVKKKHSSHAVTSDLSLTHAGLASEFFLADGLVLTGEATGEEANEKEIKDLQSAVHVPVLIGWGVTTENVERFIEADALIVGSHFKVGGLWSNDLDPAKVNAFMKKVDFMREK